MRDVTDYKELEHQLFHAQKMESVGTLSGGIAHDFNNILAAIIPNVQIMKMLPDLSEQARECADNIENAARKANRPRSQGDWEVV